MAEIEITAGDSVPPEWVADVIALKQQVAAAHRQLAGLSNALAAVLARKGWREVHLTRDELLAAQRTTHLHPSPDGDGGLRLALTINAPTGPRRKGGR